MIDDGDLPDLSTHATEPEDVAAPYIRDLSGLPAELAARMLCLFDSPYEEWEENAHVILPIPTQESEKQQALTELADSDLSTMSARQRRRVKQKMKKKD